LASFASLASAVDAAFAASTRMFGLHPVRLTPA
jgi:hypothetical protein